ncbi:putative bifunctional diguanylate cyclase/phosphodiesterase [Magnetococcales bacterium HHB-1]
MLKNIHLLYLSSQPDSSVISSDSRTLSPAHYQLDVISSLHNYTPQKRKEAQAILWDTQTHPPEKWLDKIIQFKLQHKISLLLALCDSTDNQHILTLQETQHVDGLTTPFPFLKQQIFQIIQAHHSQKETQANLLAEVEKRQSAEQQLQNLQQQQKHLEHLLKQKTESDELTGLPNRNRFYDRLSQAMAMASRSKTNVVIMLLDLDKFKRINDSMGHHIGDQLLKKVAKRLVSCVRESDTIARPGGDEFIILLPNLLHIPHIELVASKIQRAFDKPFNLHAEGEVKAIYISTSIGITLYPNDASTGEELVKNADNAMFQAKKAGRNTFRFFTPEMNTAAKERVKLESDLRYALDHNQFELYYQPKVALKTGQIAGMEALIRWNHETTGMISPGIFIPLAEETGLIVPIGEWVLETACIQTKQWIDQGFSDLKVAINLSARQFGDHKRLLQKIRRVLQKTGLSPNNLELEITESMVMEDVDQAIITMEKIKDMGIDIAVDDFGTGYSSLGSLKRFPIQTLKIDQSFVRELSRESNDAAIVSAIISMANKLSLSVVAEGVETAEQLQFLKQDACNEIQGYFFSKPLPKEDFFKLLQENRAET